MRYTNLPTESDEYLAAREELRLAELHEMEQRERVAALRRALPLGPLLDDYSLIEVPGDLEGGDAGSEVLLRDLFTAPHRPLIIYHLMFGKRQTTPCPMCTMWVDGFNGVARHVRQRADVAIVAAAELGPLRSHARARGWDDLLLLSAGSSTFKLDLGSEDDEGNQAPMVSVLTQGPDGGVRHFYSGTPQLCEESSERGIDLLCATWSLLDLTPEGRGDWYASLTYT